MKRALLRILLLILVPIAGCQNPETLLQRGNAAYINGDLRNAAMLYERALEHPSTRAVANYNLGRLLLEHGDPQRALGYLEVADGPLVVKFRAQAYRITGQLDKARESLQQASSNDPDTALEWALLEIDTGNLPSALELLEQAKKSPVLWEKATLESSNVKAKMGDIQGATIELEMLLRARPQRADISNRLKVLKEQNS